MPKITIRRSSALAILTILMVFLIEAISWGITCLITYGVSLLLANTFLAFEWSWFLATGIWLIFILLKCSLK